MAGTNHHHNRHTPRHTHRPNNPPAVSSVIGENGVFTPTWWETESFARDFPDAQPGDQYTLKFDAGAFLLSCSLRLCFYA